MNELLRQFIDKLSTIDAYLMIFSLAIIFFFETNQPFILYGNTGSSLEIQDDAVVVKVSSKC